MPSSDEPTNLLTTLITQTQRNVGSAPLPRTDNFLDTPAGPLYTNHWTATDATRIALLLCLLITKPDETQHIVRDIYRMADEAEHVSIVKGAILCSLDNSLKSVVLEAGRTNSRLLFAALALNNPYPADQGCPGCPGLCGCLHLA